MQNHLFDRLNLSGLAGSNPNEYEKIFNSIAELSNKTALSVAKDIDKQISKYDMLGNQIDQVIQKQRKFTQQKTITQNKAEGIARYSDLQQRVEEIKKSATDLSKVTIDTKKDIKDIEKATISYKDSLGRLVQEKYKLIETDKKIDNGNGLQTVKEWELVSRKVTDNIEEQKKQQQSIQDTIAKTIKQREEENRLWNQNQAKAINKNLEDEYKNNLKINEAIQQRKEKLQSLLREVANKGYLSTNELREVGSGLFKSNSLEDLDKYERKLDILIEKQKELKRQANLGTQVSKVSSTLFDFGRQDDLKQFMSQFHDGEIKIIKFKDGLQDGKNRLVEFNVQVQKGKKDVEEYKYYFDELTGAIYRNNAALKNNSNNQLGLAEQLGIAFERTFVWATAMTGFYGVIRLIQSMTQEILLVDNAMTELKRVMDATPDQYNKMLQQSIQLSQELGNNVYDVLKSLNEAARSFEDLSQEDLLEVTKTATIASNVSDLSAEEAMQSLIGTMNAFNIAATDSIQIVDKMNEVDNNFSVSTRQLSESLSRSASVAKVYGATLDDVIAHTTAIASVTMESGEVIGRALKTIYSRITTMDQAKDVLDSVGISIYDMQGQVRPVTEILESLAQKWNSLSNEQKQNIGVILAGREHLTRLVALLENYDTAIKATETSLNSQGSAFKENQKYQESLEARINKLKNIFTELSIAIGDAVLTDSFIGVVEGLKGLAEIGVKISNSFGVLPIVFGAVYTSAVLLNKNFKDFVTSAKGIKRVKTNVIESFNSAINNTSNYLRTTKAEIASTTVGMSAMQKATTSAKIAWRGLGASVRGFLAATGIGLAFVAVGYGIEKLISSISEYNQKQKQIKQEATQLASTYASNEDKIQSLADKYEKLSNEVSKGLRPDNDKEYLKVQQELYNLLPTLADRVDKNGQAHLRSANAVRQELDSLKELAHLKSQKFVDNFDKNIDNVKSKIDDLKQQINDLQNPPMTAVDWKAGIPKQMTNDDRIQIAINQREINAQIEQAIGLYKQYADAYADTLGVKKQLNEEDRKYIQTLIEENKANLLSKQGSKEVIKQIENTVGKIGDVRKVIGNLFSTDKILNFSYEQVNALVALSSAIEKGNVNWDKWKDKLNKTFKDSELVNSVIARLKGSYNELTDAVNENTVAFGENGLQIKVVTDEGEEFVNVYDNLNKKYQETSDKMAVLNKLMEDMAEGKQITAAEAMELISKVNELADAITIENGQVVVNIKRVEEMRKANKKAYFDIIESIKQGLIAQTTATISKLKLFSSEIRGLKNIEEAHRLVGEAIDKLNEKIYNARSIQEAMGYEKQKRELESYGEELDKLANMEKIQQEALNQVGTSFEENAKKQDKANKSTEQSIYVADKYKQALEKVNTELEKINAIKSKFPQHSKEYQKALKQEIELLKQQKKIYENQAKDLQNQIKSGKIQQTGIITQKSTSNSVYTGQYADIINKAAKTYGIDPFLIAAVIKQESNFNPRAKSHAGAEGLMQLTPTTAKELGVTNPYDPSQNIMGGAKYLAQQLQRFGGNIEKALAAYNAGAGNVLKYGGIPPFKETQNYVKKVSQYYSQYSKTGTIDTSDVSRQKAEAQQAIDEAKSQLLQIQGEIANIDAEIARVEVELINAQLAGFEYNKSNYDKIVESSEASLYKYKQTSAEYRKELERQRNAMANKAKENEKEIKFLQDLIKNGNLSAIALDEMKNKLHELQIEQKQTTAKTLELNKAIIDQVLLGYDNSQMRYDQFIEKSQIQLGRLTQGSEEYRTELEKQRETLRKKNEEQIKEQKYLQYAIRNFELAPEVVEEYKNKIHELGIEIEKTTDEQKKLGDAIAEDWIMQFKNQIDDVDYKIDISKSISIFYDEKSEEYNKEIEKQNALLEKRAKLLNEERQKILELMATEDLSVEKKKELAEAYENLSVEYLDTYNQIKQNSINLLESQEEKVIESIEKQKETTEKYYDSLIEAQQERLRLLDEEYEKEDRLQKLREINDEIQKVKNDKRFSYITAEGQEILTYDKARVTELEKERDELLKQYQREDIKKAIQDEIDQLEKAKREKIEILDKEIKATRQRYDELINTEKQKWVDLIKSVQNGTLTFDALMNSWYGSSFVSLKQYSINVQEEINKIKAAFESLAQKQIPNMPQNPNTSNQLSSQSPVYTNPDLSNAEKVKSTNGHYYYKMTNTDGTTSWVIDTSVQEKLKEGYTLQQYHDGGIVGGAKTKIQSLANKLFNEKLKPNETIVKSLVGELQIPPRNLPNIVHNIGNLVNSLIPKTPVVTTSGDTIHLHNVTIKADNPQQLFKELDLYIRMNRK
ncbi:phage tail tape measure protein [Anoxybacillus flavithermus]|uniref:Phage tail tape measure protein n=1 Tax=Anoxybacillus flavithermus TaxID=33934 RepID=A0A178TPA5_9BACL|nr:phage tail tape measure protein [Anoxybacillus flavithermus]OAO83368.1 hypothetical protein TAF16_0022 [Anoxybacillus flavithermus]